MSWFWLAIIAAILWGFGYLVNQLTLKYFNSIELVIFESLFATLGSSLYFWWKGNFITFFHKFTNLKSVALILTSSFIYLIASILILKSIQGSNATLAATIEATYPIFTIIFAFLLLGEIHLNFLGCIGFCLIIIGTIIVKIYAKY